MSRFKEFKIKLKQRVNIGGNNLLKIVVLPTGVVCEHYSDGSIKVIL